MRTVTELVLLLAALLGVVGCQQEGGRVSDAARNTPTVMSMFAATPDPSRLGVFASTSSGIKELLVYGEETGMDTFRVPDLSAVPTVGSVGAFFLNMPNTDVMSSRVFWVAAPQRSFDESSCAPLPVQYQSVKGNMYKVVLPTLGNRHSGVLLFIVRMPLGTRDRTYAIRLTK